MTEQDLNDNCMRDEIARKLARIHYLEIPIEKQVVLKFMVNDLDGYCAKYFDEKKSDFEKHGLEHLVNFDLKTELNWLYDTMQSFNSPIVFGYGDCRVGNILVTEDEGTVLTDFDIAGYYYRGWDFCSFFIDFYTITDNKLEFKDESIVTEFIASYVKQCEEIHGKEYSANEQNSVQHIMKETKLFTMVYQLSVGRFFVSEDFLRVMSKQQSWVLRNL